MEGRPYKTIQSATRELREAGRLMYNNVSPTGNCIMMTLTYRGKMPNHAKMSQDMNNYHNDIRKVESSYEYLDIIEIGNQHT